VAAPEANHRLTARSGGALRNIVGGRDNRTDVRSAAAARHARVRGPPPGRRARGTAEFRPAGAPRRRRGVL